MPETKAFTARSRCCSKACRKRLQRREWHHANRERINADRRAKKAELRARRAAA